MSNWGEWEMIATLARGHRSSTSVEVGIGDDCAVLRLPSRSLHVSTDACIENVHYRSSWLTKRELAKKAMGAALSDLAAMGARPHSAVCHLTVPRGTTKRELADFGRGQREFCAEYGCELVGGNISSGETFDVVTTVFGTGAEGRSPLLRSGAQVGDEVWLVGRVGLATLGLRLLSSKKRITVARRAKREAITAFKSPRPLVREGEALARVAHAALDVSDGLVGDAGHLARSSQVRVILERATILNLFDDATCKLALALGVDPADALLFGGEDYALLATGPSRRRPRFAVSIGRIDAGRSGVYLHDGSRLRELRGGYQHLR
jgi:thiamine-monophosphate kinase